MNQNNAVCYVYASSYSLINGNSRYVRTAERKCFDQAPSQGLILFNGIHIIVIFIQFVFTISSILVHLGCVAVYFCNRMYSKFQR